ncbi:MAG: hypothetical protein ACTHKV_02695 [Flavipsychrobacter sp.]
MTRFIAILMLGTVLMIQTPVHQFLKLGTLVEHYYEHKNLNSEISFWGFLEMHYAHDDVKHADYDRDMQLPFKHCSHLGLLFTYFEHTTVYNWKQSTYFPDIVKPLSAYSTPFHTAEALSNIWQPPRC